LLDAALKEVRAGTLDSRVGSEMAALAGALVRVTVSGELDGRVRSMERLHLSARVYRHTLKRGRTIADLAGKERIGVAHAAEAVQCRQRDAAA